MSATGAWLGCVWFAAQLAIFGACAVMSVLLDRARRRSLGLMATQKANIAEAELLAEQARRAVEEAAIAYIILLNCAIKSFMQGHRETFVAWEEAIGPFDVHIGTRIGYESEGEL